MFEVNCAQRRCEKVILSVIYNLYMTDGLDADV